MSVDGTNNFHSNLIVCRLPLTSVIFEIGAGNATDIRGKHKKKQ